MLAVLKIIYSNSFVRLIIIPVSLTIIFLALATFHNSLGISVISYGHSRNNLKSIPRGKILQGEKVTGEFLAKDNNLGIVSLRVQTFDRVSFDDEDILVFRLKQKGAKQWYYTGTYRSGGFYLVPFYPFGFPIIHNSKGKVYQFELASLKGNDNNAIIIAPDLFILGTSYQMSRHDIFASKWSLFSFLVKKVINSLTNVDYLLYAYSVNVPYTSIYLYPVFFYFLWQLLPKKYKKKPFLLVFCTVVSTYLYAFFVYEDLFVILFSILFIWVIAIIKYRLNTNVTFIFAGCLILSGIPFLYFQNILIMNKLSTIAFIILVIGMIQTVYQQLGESPHALVISKNALKRKK